MLSWKAPSTIILCIPSSNFQTSLNELKILVVDDMPIVRSGTTLLLESLGYEVDEAASGVEAIELYKTGHYAAIIMDYNMPEMNGFECTAIIREHEKKSGHRIPIICMSASNDDDEMKAACMTANLNDYLNKDCSPAELKNILSKWIR